MTQLARVRSAAVATARGSTSHDPVEGKRVSKKNVTGHRGDAVDAPSAALPDAQANLAQARSLEDQRAFAATQARGEGGIFDVRDGAPALHWTPAYGSGNGHAISHYLHQLVADHVSPARLHAEEERASQLGQRTYPSGWAEGHHTNGLAIALKHGLTDSDVGAIQGWTSKRICDDLNHSLRYGAPFKEGHEAFLGRLVSGLSKLPGYTERTYRGTRMPQSVIDEMRKTGEFVDKGVLAASKVRDAAEQFVPPPEPGKVNVVMVIDSHQGRDISLVGHHHELREVDFLPNTRMKVTAISTRPDGRLEIHLDDFAPGETAVPPAQR